MNAYRKNRSGNKFDIQAILKYTFENVKKNIDQGLITAIRANKISKPQNYQRS